MWGLSSLARDQTYVFCIGRQILNHWTTREVPNVELLMTVLLFLQRWRKVEFIARTYLPDVP